MKDTFLLAAAVILTTFSSSQVFANSLSIGLTVGQSSDELTAESCGNDRGYFIFITEGQEFTCSVDDSDTSIGINLGYHFSDTWGLELGYFDLGQTSQFLTGPETGSFSRTGTNVSEPETIDYTAAYFAGTFTYNVKNDLSLTARLGGAKVEYELIPTLFDTILNEDSTSVMAGLALNYEFKQNWNAHLRYDYFDLDYELFDADSMDNISLGVSYKF